MENEAEAVSGSVPLAIGQQNSPLAPANVEAQQQQQVAIKEKKRKDTSDFRSKAWEHFEKIFDDKGKLIKARCLYCAKKLEADTKRNGTSSIRNFILSYRKNPNPKDIRQSLLTLKPDVHNSEPLGVIGT